MMRCTNCHGQDIRRSRYRATDLPLLLLLLRPYRCVHCLQRYWRFPPAPRPLRALLNGLIALCLLLAVGGAFIWPRSRTVRDSLMLLLPSGNGYVIETAPGVLCIGGETHGHEAIAFLPDEIRPTAGWSFRSVRWETPYTARLLSSSPAAEDPAPGTPVLAGHKSEPAATTFTFARPIRQHLGFGWVSRTVSLSPPIAPVAVTVRYVRLLLPLWFVSFLLAIPAAWRMASILWRRHRARALRDGTSRYAGVFDPSGQTMIRSGPSRA